MVVWTTPMPDEPLAIQRALETAEGLIFHGRHEEARDLLLQAWRRSRAPALAELIESLSLLLDVPRLPGPPADFWRWRKGAACYPWHVHPWRALPAPDPRATRPLVLRANHAFDFFSEYSPRWPADLSRSLAEHGDPRALDFLERALAGRRRLFADELRRLSEQMPRARALEPGEREVVARMAASVARAFSDDSLRDELAREADPHRALQLVSLGLTRWLPRLGWHIYAPRFERGVFTGCSVPPIPELLEAAVGLPEWATADTIHLNGDPGWARDVHPSAYVQQHCPGSGPRARRAAVALLTHPVMASLRTVGTLPVEVVRGLAEASFRAPFTQLHLWYDPALPEALARLDLPALAELRLLSVAGTDDAFIHPDALQWLWALPAGRRLRRLVLQRVSIRHWHAWLEDGAVAANLETLVLTGGDWTMEIRRAPEAGRWEASCELRERWDVYDSEFQDPPTPAADLLEFLEAVAPDRLAALRLDSLGEWADDAEGRARMAAAARRQKHLRRLVLGDDEDADESGSARNGGEAGQA